MARYRGAKTKISRKFGEPIFGEDKYFERRKYPPGQHGLAQKRAKKSEYAEQLAEKQKAKYTYGILEKQFENLFKKASRSRGITGEVLLQLCESRLDNVVFRLGIGKTRDAARQFVSHRHILVNGKEVSIPSYQVKPGDVVGVKTKSQQNPEIQGALTERTDYDWLAWNHQNYEGIFHNVPERLQIPENIKEQLIVELYSK